MSRWRPLLRGSRSAWLLAGALVLLAAGGCDQSAPPSATQPAVADTAAAPTAVELADLHAWVTAIRPAPMPRPTPGLPAGHPPLPVAESQPAAMPAEPLRLTYVVPETWIAETARSPMRAAQYRLPRAAGDAEDAELSLMYFGPDTGGTIAANVLRWQGQFSTPADEPLPASALLQESFDVGGLHVTLVEVAGRYHPPAMMGMAATPPRDGFRMLGALVETPRGLAVFKALGPDATITAHRAGFRALLDSVALGE